MLSRPIRRTPSRPESCYNPKIQHCLNYNRFGLFRNIAFYYALRKWSNMDGMFFQPEPRRSSQTEPPLRVSDSPELHSAEQIVWSNPSGSRPYPFPEYNCLPSRSCCMSHSGDNNPCARAFQAPKYLSVMQQHAIVTRLQNRDILLDHHNVQVLCILGVQIRTWRIGSSQNAQRTVKSLW